MIIDSDFPAPVIVVVKGKTVGLCSEISTEDRTYRRRIYDGLRITGIAEGKYDVAYTLESFVPDDKIRAMLIEAGVEIREDPC